MSIDLSANFFKLLRHFRRDDLVLFHEEHNRLYDDAKKRSDYSAVTAHYYSVMSPIINEYFNGNFHLVPPLKDGQNLNDALSELHLIIAQWLHLQDGTQCVDIGCGIGGVMRDLAFTGAYLTGITVANNEVDIGNDIMRENGLERCHIIHGDCSKLPLIDDAYDCAYAVYALKYLEHLTPTLREVKRILRPGGYFLVYDLLKTATYNPNSIEHRRIIERLEYACGMPSLHTRDELINEAHRCDLQLVKNAELDELFGKPYYHCFTGSSLFMWLISSKLVDIAISAAQTLRLLPPGFFQFKKIFLCDTVLNIVQAGKLGILSGSELFLFRKLEADPQNCAA